MKNYSFKFKTKKYSKKCDEFVKNIDTSIKEIFRDRIDPEVILSNYRKVFRVTPAALVENPENKYDEDIIFVIFVLINYTSCSDETIQNKFKLNDEAYMKIEQKIEQCDFDEKVNQFFEPFIEGVLCNKLSNLHFQEELYLYENSSESKQT